MIKTDDPSTKQTFETALIRLEQILEKINSSEVALAEAVTLYEEADKLMGLCNKQLTEAEERIEILMRHRDGTVALNSEGLPQAQPFPKTPHN